MWMKIVAWNLARTLREIPVWFERLRWIGRRRPEENDHVETTVEKDF